MRDPAQRVYPPRQVAVRPPPAAFSKPAPAPQPPAPRLVDGPSDLELLAGWRAGDRACGAALYERHAGKVRAFLRRQLHDKRVVEDLVQESFEALQTSKAAIGEVGAYLHRIAFHKFTRHIRERRGADEACDPAELGLTPDEDADPEHVAAVTSERSWLVAAMERLAPKYQAVLKLVFWENKTLPEVAKALGVPLATATSRLRLAKERLAKVKRELEAPRPAPDIVFEPPRPEQPRPPPRRAEPPKVTPAPAPPPAPPKPPTASKRPKGQRLSKAHQAALARDSIRAELRQLVAEAARAGMTQVAATKMLGIPRSRLIALLAEVPDAPRFVDGRKVLTPARAEKIAAQRRSPDKKAQRKAAGAAPPERTITAADLHAWLLRELPRVSRTLKHTGNFRYLFGLTPWMKRRLHDPQHYPQLPYPKVTP